MATQIMLHECNSYERVIKLSVNRLTLQGRLSSLQTTRAAFWLLWLRVWVCVALVGTAAGCATAPGTGSLTKDSPPEVKRSVLTERINARWDALIKGDLDQAYTFMSQASKDAYSLGVYKSKVHPGMWRSVKIDSIDCDGAVCWAKMVLTYDHPIMKGVQTPFTESWIIEKGSAWFVFQPSS
jgi:hypothetical protein